MKKCNLGKGTILTANFLKSAFNWPGNRKHVVMPDIVIDTEIKCVKMENLLFRKNFRKYIYLNDLNLHNWVLTVLMFACKCRTKLRYRCKTFRRYFQPTDELITLRCKVQQLYRIPIIKDKTSSLASMKIVFCVNETTYWVHTSPVFSFSVPLDLVQR